MARSKRTVEAAKVTTPDQMLLKISRDVKKARTMIRKFVAALAKERLMVSTRPDSDYFMLTPTWNKPLPTRPYGGRSGYQGFDMSMVFKVIRDEDPDIPLPTPTRVMNIMQKMGWKGWTRPHMRPSDPPKYPKRIGSGVLGGYYNEPYFILNFDYKWSVKGKELRNLFNDLLEQLDGTDGLGKVLKRL